MTPDEFQPIFERYSSRVLRFLSRRHFTPQEAKELTQETFLRVYKGRGGFPEEADVEKWVMTVAANVRRNALRDRRAQKRDAPEEALDAVKEETLAAPRDPLFGAGNPKTPQDAFLERERAVSLRRAIEQLPDQMRRCLLFRYFHELEYKEIAVLMRISIDTVKAHLYQGRNRLRKLLGPPAGTEEPEG